MSLLNEKKFFNGFNLIDGVGPAAFKKLLAYFGSLRNGWLAKTDDFVQAGLEPSLIEQIRKRRNQINLDFEMEKLRKEKIKIITLPDEEYPKPLKEIYDPPALIYLKGEIIAEDRQSLAIVGTRKLSAYGSQITPLLAADLVGAGFTIVSGLAKGIDTLAHSAALKAGGRTIAVLGSGLDSRSVYPPINKRLAEEISQNGAVISEFPFGAQPLANHFPQRNRIISGLSLGVLVIEAPEKSGAILTANNALEQNREVFAVPGHIFSQNSLGTNNLIKMGAKLVTHTNDILQELNLPPLAQQNQKSKKKKPSDENELLIFNLLSQEPVHIDKIINQAKMSSSTVNSCLALMEIKGIVRNLGGNNYVRL